jgi:HSP20 family protein
MLPVLRSNSTARPANRLGSLFGRAFGDDGVFMDQAWSGAPLAMWEDDDHIWIEAELPGVAEEDVAITVRNDMLFLRGELKPVAGRRYLYNGRSYGRFERAIALPGAIETDGARATLKDGVLLLDLPKSPAAKPRKIELRAT